MTVDGETLQAERADYDGFHTRPMSWADVILKFNGLAEAHLDRPRRDIVVTLVRDLERHDVADLMTVLGQAR